MTKRLQQTIATLVDSQPDDQRLRDHLEGLVRDEAFPGLTWFWGPLLYRRNRVLFRSLIQNYFSEWSRTSSKKWEHIAWAQHVDRLGPWLDEARQFRDTRLVRRLMRWKFAKSKGWGVDEQAWNAALLASYRNAASPAARAIVLDEFDEWVTIDEATAEAMYATDRSAKAFILKHLPLSFWTGDNKRRLWTQLAETAERAGDQDFHDALYRRQAPVKVWTAHVLSLAKTITNPETLCDTLERYHPEGYGLSLGDTLLQLLKARERDVVPYVRGKLNSVVGTWIKGAAKPFIELAAAKGWWDVWAAAIRGSSDDSHFNTAVTQLATAESNVSESERIARLQALAGVSREWNWNGLGLARVHSLRDSVATQLYNRYPDLIHGAFQPNVAPTWGQGYPTLLAAAQAAGDEDLIDTLASRYVTRPRLKYAFANKNHDQLVDTANSLAEDYQLLRDRNPAEYARRAANVLSRIPAYSIYSIDGLLEDNQLARLLFVRSLDDYLTQPAAVRDLVEGSDIHVQMLAYRILGRDDDRARRLAAESLDILLGTLLRPLHRKTRIAAFSALFNAAKLDARCAERIVGRAREAMRLPDRKYPKEQLVGLIGQIVHLHPQLQSERERPVIYGLAKAGDLAEAGP